MTGEEFVRNMQIRDKNEREWTEEHNMSDDCDPLHNALEDAIWQALDAEQGMPHSGVDPACVIPEFLRLLAEAGYTVAAVSDTDRSKQ